MASVPPNETDTPPNETELFASKAFVTSPDVNVFCFVASCVVVEFDKSVTSLDAATRTTLISLDVSLDKSDISVLNVWNVMEDKSLTLLVELVISVDNVV